MKDIKYLAIGFFALFTTIGLNLRHAVNDYGILNNKLHVEVLAQSNSNGGSSSGGGGSSGGSNNSGVGNNIIMSIYKEDLNLVHCIRL